jgi:hypothetical protein
MNFRHQPSMRDTAVKLMAIASTALGAICSSWLMGFVAGWKPGVLGYVAWALMPYAVLAAILLCVSPFRVNRSVQLLSAWAGIIIALGGPLLYFDAMLVHVDAQGALVVLMVPVIQTVLGMAVAVVVILWQWRISRSAAKPPQQTESIVSLTTTALRPVTGWRKLLRIVFVSLVIVVALLYALISIVQNADSATIKVAKEVDAFIVQYCVRNSSLPASDILRGQFPDLNRDSGWFFYTNDKTYLIVQYPVRWSNKDAIGKPKTSEVTATVYAYTVNYHCGKDK